MPEWRRILNFFTSCVIPIDSFLGFSSPTTLEFIIRQLS